MSDIGKSIDHVIRVGLGGVLREAGFTRRGRTFYRRNAHVVSLTNVQASRYNAGSRGEFTINLGVYFPEAARLAAGEAAEYPSQPECHLRMRIGHLMSGGHDHWWTINARTNLDRLAAEVGRVWAGCAPGWFADHEEPRRAAEALLANRNIHTAVPLYLSLGDRAAAGAALEAGLAAARQEANDHWQQGLRELGLRYGLDVGPEESSPSWQIHGPHWYTEQAWAMCENPHHVLSILDHLGVRDNRKFRLAAAGCCRAAWDRLSAAERDIVETVESYMAGQVKFAEVAAAARRLYNKTRRGSAGVSLGHRQPDSSVSNVLHHLLGSSWGGPLPSSPGKGELARKLVAVLRDVFGDPFHPVELSPAWRTPAVSGLARAIHDDRDFDRLPILGDALEDAGCDNPVVLSHCREAVIHVQGCWLVEAILAGAPRPGPSRRH